MIVCEFEPLTNKTVIVLNLYLDKITPVSRRGKQRSRLSICYDLFKTHKIILQERLEWAKREREIEVLEQLRQQAAVKQVIEKTVFEKEGRAKRELEIEVAKKQRPKKVKARGIPTAKQKADSKFVSDKRMYVAVPQFSGNRHNNT